LRGAAPGSFAWHTFAELSGRDVHDILRLRCRVFIVEQACPYEDVDGKDPEALHLLARLPGAELTGYLRCFPPAAAGPARIGRVVTAPEARGVGLGRRLMLETLAYIARRHGPVPVELAAQLRLEGFYGGFGLVRVSPDYLEDGIPHCDMRLQPS